MIPENIKNLVLALIKKTEDKKAIWGKSARDNEFKLNFDKGAVTIESEQYQNNAYVGFAIYNSFGDKIDNFNFTDADDGFDLLISLHNAAKRDFYKVDETIDSLFNEIKADKSIGKRIIEKGPDELPF